MTVGYSAAGACWATASEAVDAYYSGSKEQFNSFAFSDLVYFGRSQPVKVSGVWKHETQYCSLSAYGCSPPVYRNASTDVVGICTMSEDSGTSGTSATSDPLQSFTDGALLGWGVVAAMAVAWGITVLRRGL